MGCCPFLVGGSVFVDMLFIVTPILGFCDCSTCMFCCSLLYVHSCFAIIVMGKRESWLLCLLSHPGVSWLLCGSSSRCYGVVCSLWLWYFLIILTIFTVCQILRLGVSSLEMVKWGILVCAISTKISCAGLSIWAATCDFQQCGILTSVDSDEPVQPPFKPRNSKWCSISSLTVT